MASGIASRAVSIAVSMCRHVEQGQGMWHWVSDSNLFAVGKRRQLTGSLAYNRRTEIHSIPQREHVTMRQDDYPDNATGIMPLSAFYAAEIRQCLYSSECFHVDVFPLWSVSTMYTRTQRNKGTCFHAHVYTRKQMYMYIEIKLLNIQLW